MTFAARLLFIVLLLGAAFAAQAVTLLKKTRDPASMGLYHLTNAPGFTSAYYFITYKIDDQDLREKPAPFGRVYMEPGEHTVVVSFFDYSGYIVPINFKQRLFQGTYTIRFTMKPGMRYAPMFNLNAPEKEQASEMCIAEVSQGAPLSATRKPMPYVACGTPTLDPVPENIKVCRETAWIGFTPKVHKEACAPLTSPGAM